MILPPILIKGLIVGFQKNIQQATADDRLKILQKTGTIQEGIKPNSGSYRLK